jgi:hypothetical protein
MLMVAETTRRKSPKASGIMVSSNPDQKEDQGGPHG